MIYCPTCNTANREGSKFCNECGTNLQKASLLRCPKCGDMNPSTRTECANCGTRLLVQAGPEPEPPPEEEPAQPAPAAAVAPAPPPAAATVPVAAVESAPPPAATPAPAQAEEMPDWLRDLRPAPEQLSSPPATAPSAGAVAEPVSEDVPDWLREFRSTAAQPETPEPAAPVTEAPAHELPAWVGELQPPAAAASEGSPPADSRPAAPEPLAESVPATPEPAASLQSAPEVSKPLEPGELPDWLRAFHESAQAAPAAAEPARAVSEAVPADERPSAEIPDWLKELAPAQAAAPAEASLEGVAVEELPEWLKPPAPPAPPAEAAAPAAQPADATVATGLAPAEVPSWLQALRPGGIETLSGDVMETSGLLAGIRGALPVESVLTRRHQSEPVETARASVPVGGFAELFAPQSPAPPVVTTSHPVRGTSFRASWLAWLVLLLFLLAIVPFLPLPFLQDTRGANVTVHQPASDYYQTIEALRPGQIIMVAFDYTGGSRAELDPQARATLLHLFQNKQHILTVAFVPEGGAIANETLNGLNPANTSFAYPYAYGDTHLNLGYQSGGDAALRSLVQSSIQFTPNDFGGKPAANFPLTQNLKSIKDVALLVVLSDDAGEVKRWVEQVVRPSGKPLIAGVSAAAGPTARPYYDGKQIGGLLEGARGSAEYEVLLAHPSTATSTLDAISYVVIALVAIIALGIVVALVRRRRVRA